MTKINLRQCIFIACVFTFFSACKFFASQQKSEVKSVDGEGTSKEVNRTACPNVTCEGILETSGDGNWSICDEFCKASGKACENLPTIVPNKEMQNLLNAPAVAEVECVQVNFSDNTRLITHRIIRIRARVVDPTSEKADSSQNR